MSATLPLFRLRWLGLVVSVALVASGAQAKPSRWTAEIDALTKDDPSHPPAAHGIVFVGSSSIRFWETLEQDFPGLPVIRRGFGGSELADSVYYLDRLVLPYQPRIVVVYAGENDIAAGKTPEAVAADFHALRDKLQAALPETKLIYLSMKPSPSRWTLYQKMQRGNALIAAECATDPHLVFLEVGHALLGPDGQPRPELYRPDMLHMKHDGYAIWSGLLTPLLAP